MRNLLVAQSGGPTSAINATIAGVIMEAHASDQVDTIYGAVNGIKGVLEERFVNLSEKVPGEDELEILCQTPAAALGSCRVKLKNPAEDDSQFQEIIRIFRKHEIMYFIYAGGNDSMDTVDKLAAYCKEHKIEDIHVMGAPKTIDNDLVGTDHCPGFGSAAKYIATTFSELERDCHVYDTKAVTIVEVMGRNAGWITAASALARRKQGDAPHLIYLPERNFNEDEFLEDVSKLQKKQGGVVVLVSEGLHDANGESIVPPIFKSERAVYYGDVSSHLANLVVKKLGVKARSEKPGLCGRASVALQSPVDREEARQAGTVALRSAVEGNSGVMVGFERVPGTVYQMKTKLVPIKEVMLYERKMPDNFINERGNDVTQEFVDWCRPLIGDPLPEFLNFKDYL